MTTARKDDSGKPRYDLIPPEVLRMLADQFRYGAEKYGDRNWEHGLNFGRLYRACIGHLNEWHAGNEFDEEGRPHLAGALTSLTMLVASFERFRGSALDDRPQIPPPARIEVPLYNHPAGHAILTYDPVDFQDIRITPIPPVETSVDSGNSVAQAIANDPKHPMHDVFKPEEPTSSTGETSVRYTHKVHYQTSVFGEIMCDTRNIRKMSDRANDVTCGRCLKMMQ